MSAKRRCSRNCCWDYYSDSITIPDSIISAFERRRDADRATWDDDFIFDGDIKTCSEEYRAEIDAYVKLEAVALTHQADRKAVATKAA